MNRWKNSKGQRLLAVWIAGLCILGFDVGAMIVAKELAEPSRAQQPVQEESKQAEGGETGAPFKDVLLFPLI